MVSSYKNMSTTIFEEMGRRKFRLSVHRKNEERRKAAPALRRVSVPSDLITAVPVGSMTIQSSKADLHPVVENQRMEDTGPFLVSFPLSVFMLSEVHTLDVLLSRLKMTTLPSMWVILDGLPLFICRMHSTQLQPTVLMSVKVTAELQWSATVLDKMVTPEQFPELGEVPSTISAVTQLCRRIEILDDAKLCIGNPDDILVQMYELFHTLECEL